MRKRRQNEALSTRIKRSQAMAELAQQGRNVGHVFDLAHWLLALAPTSEKERGPGHGNLQPTPHKLQHVMRCDGSARTLPPHLVGKCTGQLGDLVKAARYVGDVVAVR
eukprot:364443-Chlamydomonas_euryale.AAC.31